MAKGKRSSEWETITPEMAKEMLAASQGNPRYGNSTKMIDNRKVEKLARDMRSGNWLETNGTIGFDWNGHLIDGHHRLSAVVKSGKPQSFIVVRGLSPLASKVIDCGSSRSQSSRFSNSYGVGAALGSARTLAAARISLRFRKGDHYVDAKMTDTELFDYIVDHSDGYSFAYKVTNLGKPKYLTAQSFIAQAIFEAYEYGVDKRLLQRFCDIVNTGRYLGDEETSAMELRDWLLEDKEKMMKAKTTRNVRENTILSEKVQSYIEKFVEGKPIKRSISENQIMGIYTLMNMGREEKHNE